jgi:hypothetical protein
MRGWRVHEDKRLGFEVFERLTKQPRMPATTYRGRSIRIIHHFNGERIGEQVEVSGILAAKRQDRKCLTLQVDGVDADGGEVGPQTIARANIGLDPRTVWRGGRHQIQKTEEVGD